LIKKYSAAFILLLFCISASAQIPDRARSSNSTGSSGKGLTARFNYTGLIDPFDQNLSFGAEYKLNGHWSTGLDLAWVLTSAYLSESKHANGLIARPFVRYYPWGNKKGFFEAVVNYKYVSYGIKDWVGKDVTNGVPAYQEYTTFHFNKNAFGLHLNAGTSANLSRDKRLKMEFYLGIGVRFKTQGADIGEYDRQWRWLGKLYDPKFSGIVLPMGARLVYDIR
jgi:hypothetical protein